MARYTITPHCREDKLEMPDGATRLFINAPAYDKCSEERLSCFMRYLVAGTIGDDFTRRLDEVVSL